MKKRIGLLATGRSECEGLPGALQHLFGHKFDPIFMRPVDREPFGNISSPVSPTSLAHTTATKIVQKVAAELDNRAYEFIVILDDLEVDNLGHPDRVIEHIRLAVRNYLAQAEMKSLIPVFRKQVSFHLAVPMLEAWFFADRNVLTDLHLNAYPRLTAGTDPEAFSTDDPLYDLEDCSECPPWQHLSGSRRKAHRPPWTHEYRKRHPKAYLSWLMKDPNEKGCTRYKETHHAVRALAKLDWEAVLNQPNHYNYLRAFLEDISIALDVSLPWLTRPAVTTLTKYLHGGSVLRNL